MIDRFENEFDFLSNFYPCVINYDGIVYPSTEHAYQAHKSLSRDVRQDIATCRTPGLAKKAGRRVVIRKDWDDVKLQVMEDVLRIKFGQPMLAGKLIATEPQELVEGNTWDDIFWGVCKGIGENHLGKLLMKIRKELENV